MNHPDDHEAKAEVFIKSALDHMGYQRKGQRFLAEDLAVLLRSVAAEARREEAEKWEADVRWIHNIVPDKESKQVCDELLRRRGVKS